MDIFAPILEDFLLNSCHDRDGFESIMSYHIENWETIRIIEERHRLMRVFGKQEDINTINIGLAL